MRRPGGFSRPTRTQAGILLALLVLIAFWPILSGRRTFFHLDLRYEHLPVWDVTQKALRAGESPFWIDGEFCGHPLLFTQEAPLFYPLTVPLLLTGAPVHRLADLFSLFHFWLAGFAAFLLLEDLEADNMAALFGGVAWMLSARLLQSAIWPNAVAVSALLPLLLLGVARIADGRERTSGVLIAAASGGLAILAFRPHVLLGAAPLLLAAAAGFLVKSPNRLRAAADVGVAAILALALGAPALLPSAALYPEMSRAGGLSRVERDLYPIGFGSGLDMVFLPVDGELRWPEAAAYPGVLAGSFFLLGIALAFKRGAVFAARGLFLALLVGGSIGLLFAFGEAGPYRLFADLPVLHGFRVPARFLTSWSLAVALGSALVLSRLLRRFSRPIPAGAIAVLLLAGDLVWHSLRAAPTSTAALDSVEPNIVEVLRSRLGQDDAGFPRRYWPLTTPAYLTSYPDRVRESFARRYDALNGALGMRFGLESVSGAGPALARTALLLAKPTRDCAMLAGAGLIVGSSGPPPGQARPPDLTVRERKTRAASACSLAGRGESSSKRALRQTGSSSSSTPGRRVGGRASTERGRKFFRPTSLSGVCGSRRGSIGSSSSTTLRPLRRASRPASSALHSSPFARGLFERSRDTKTGAPSENGLGRESVPLKAVFFDAGATLIRPDPPVEEVYAREFSDDRIRFSSDQVSRALTRAWEEVHAQGGRDRYGGVRGEPDFWRAFLNRVRSHLDGGAVSAQGFSRLAAHFGRGSSWAVYEDVLPALEDLSRRVSSRSLGSRPGFRRTCARLGVSPAQALHVGDSLVEDYQGAIGAGLSALLLDRENRFSGRARCIRSLEELPARIGNAA